MFQNIRNLVLKVKGINDITVEVDLRAVWKQLKYYFKF
jgi:hypothetical protein